MTLPLLSAWVGSLARFLSCWRIQRDCCLCAYLCLYLINWVQGSSGILKVLFVQRNCRPCVTCGLHLLAAYMYLQPNGLILQWLLVILTPFYQLRRERALTVMAVQMGCPSFLGFMTKMKAYIAMVSVQFGYAGMCIVSVLCLKKGMSHYVLVVYRHAAATAALAPFAFVLERFFHIYLLLFTTAY